MPCKLVCRNIIIALCGNEATYSICSGDCLSLMSADSKTSGFLSKRTRAVPPECPTGSSPFINVSIFSVNCTAVIWRTPWSLTVMFLCVTRTFFWLKARSESSWWRSDGEGRLSVAQSAEWSWRWAAEPTGDGESKHGRIQLASRGKKNTEQI